MQNITSGEELKDAILLLESERDEKVKDLKEQFLFTYEALKPANLIKNAISDITTSPDILENVLGSVIGMVTGFLSRKIMVGGTSNVFKRLFGTVLQFVVTNYVSRHPEAIKAFSQFIVHTVSPAEEKNA